MADKNVSGDNRAEDNAFDDITRILASAMPRRQAVRLIAGTLVSSTIVGLSSLRVLSQSARQGLSVAELGLKTPITKLNMENMDVGKVVQMLGKKYRVPISFIQARHEKPVTLNISKGFVKDLLNQIVDQNSEYQWRQINNRIILFPNDPKFRVVLKGVNIKQTPRLQAADQFIKYLKSHKVGFENLVGVGLAGDPRLPIFNDLITLSENATVLQCFLELLGKDTFVSFSIQQINRESSPGIYVMSLTNVQIPQATPAAQNITPQITNAATGATCRPLSEEYTNKTSPGCSVGCGTEIVYQVNSIQTCTGDDCSGQRSTETIDTDNGCQPGSVSTGSGCEVSANNVVGTPSHPCTDDYALCYPIQKSCTETWTQKITVAGQLIQTCTLVWNITVTPIDGGSGTVCKGTVNRSCVSPHTSTDCCGTGDTGSPRVLCDPKSQHCISNDVCCTASQTAACNHICCPQLGAVCVTDSITSAQICCPAGSTLACNGYCCTSGETCTGGSCCPSGNATSDNKTCCTSSQIVCGTTCCDSATQVCTNGICCGKPQPQARMSHAQILQGRYATDDLSLCCQPGQVPCANTCCDAGSVCCSGSCCAGTCDDTGACITNNENK